MTDIVFQKTAISKDLRQKMNGHKSFVVWFTGLSGAGKSTLSNMLEQELYSRGIRTFLLDGDNIRHGLNADLGFSDEHRHENIRRVGEVAKLMVEAGLVVLTSFISPFRSDREFVRSLFDKDEFIEVYMKCPIDVCENRDVKGLYKKAKLGSIANFTGIDSIYEDPENAEIVIDSANMTPSESLSLILQLIKISKGISNEVFSY